MTSIDGMAVNAVANRAPAKVAATPALLRTVLLIAAATSAVAGAMFTDAHTSALAVSAAGEDLTRLLRAMAAIKAVMAAAVLAAVLWRLALPVGLLHFAAYAVACAAMAAGPGLIWDMAHVAAGAALLHGGLFCAAVLLWRDKAVVQHLNELIARRRASASRAQTHR